MITTWGKKLLSAKANGDLIPVVTVSTSGPAFIECKDAISGTIKYINPSLYTSGYNFLTALSTSTAGIAVGSNGSAESENDYALGSLISEVTGSITRETYIDTENKKYIGRAVITITNGTGNEVTIREVGRFIVPYGSNTRGANASSRFCVMIDRTVLDNPVVIPSGEAGVILYDFAHGE